MAFTLRTQIEIAAPAERVWRVLTDFTAYPSWNPFVVSIAGELTPTGKLVVKMQPPGGSAMTFKPRIIQLDPARCFAWRGQLPVPGMFTGEHRFELTPLDAGRIRFEHSEVFSGLLIPLLKKSLDGATRAGFEAMNAALKARAEALS